MYVSKAKWRQILHTQKYTEQKTATEKMPAKFPLFLGSLSLSLSPYPIHVLFTVHIHTPKRREKSWETENVRSHGEENIQQRKQKRPHANHAAQQAAAATYSRGPTS